jgi:hypothetical protein
MLFQMGYRISSKFKSMILDCGSEDNDLDKNRPDPEHYKESTQSTLLHNTRYFTHHRQVDVGGVHSNDHQKFS